MKNLKFFPSLEGFKELSGAHNVIPVYAEIMADTDTPVSAFMKIDSGKEAFLLESVEGGEKWGRYSFLGASAKAIITGTGDRVEVTERGKTTASKGDPIEALKLYMKRFKVAPATSDMRFSGGAIGFMGYDIVRHIEKLPDTNKRDLDIPDLCFIVTDSFIVFDNVEHRMKVVCNAFMEDAKDAEAAYTGAKTKIEGLVNSLRQGSVREVESQKKTTGSSVSSNFKKEDFLKAVERSKDYIAAGDIMQVVISQRFSTPLESASFDIYRALRVTNPSPYMFFLRLGGVELAGSSPEILVRVEDNVIDVRPIAGTRKRGVDETEDLALEKDLLADPKERAEHLMLVDLGRNDIGRVAKKGSVAVDEFMVVERYSHVMHIVSNVKGEMQNNADSFDVLKSCFPAGTLTGAPKIRAMEIIEELEPNKRGTYGGTVGYFAFTGNADLCITIRTVLVKDNIVYVQAGAGIVADSVPENEFEETVNKAKGVLKAVELAKEGLA